MSESNNDNTDSNDEETSPESPISVSPPNEVELSLLPTVTSALEPPISSESIISNQSENNGAAQIQVLSPGPDEIDSLLSSTPPSSSLSSSSLFSQSGSSEHNNFEFEYFELAPPDIQRFLGDALNCRNSFDGLNCRKFSDESEFFFFDYNNSTPLLEAVAEDIKAALIEYNFPHTKEATSSEVEEKAAIAVARHQVASMLSAEPDEIIFIDSVAEGCKQILLSSIKIFKTCHEHIEQKPHVVATTIESLPVRKTLEKLVNENIIDITFVPFSNTAGKETARDIIEAILPSTCLVCCTLACGITGIVRSIDVLGAALEHFEATPDYRRPLLYADASQAIGKMEVNVNDLGVDFTTLNGSTYYGPSICAMFYRKSLKPYKLNPEYYLGIPEYGLRPAEQNTPYIVGLGTASLFVCSDVVWDKYAMRELKSYLKQRIIDEFEDFIILQHCNAEVQYLSNTLCFSFTTEALFRKLNGIEGLLPNIELARTRDYRNVLTDTGIPNELVPFTISISFGKQSNEEEVDYMIDILKDKLTS